MLRHCLVRKSTQVLDVEDEYHIHRLIALFTTRCELVIQACFCTFTESRLFNEV